MRDVTRKLPTPNSHVAGENGAKTIVYNMKRKPKEKKKERRKEKRRSKKYNSKKERTLNY